VSTDGQIVWNEYLIGAFNNALLRKRRKMATSFVSSDFYLDNVGL
jgi:hypothetical protein